MIISTLPCRFQVSIFESCQEFNFVSPFFENNKIISKYIEFTVKLCTQWTITGRFEPPTEQK